MSTSDACKSARHDDGQFGTQPRAEVPDIDLPLQATAPAPTPATSYLPVDAGTKERLSRTATLFGAHAKDNWDRKRDTEDAGTLLLAMPHLMTSYETVLATALSEGKTAKDVVVRQVRQVVDRAARELVGRVWEKRRFRTKGGPLLAGKYGYGAAWSPDALNRLLDADGARRDDKHWSGRLTLEHVVPASTIAVIVSEMGKKGASADDVARMLRENVTQVVVVMNKYKTSGHRDQPSPRLMDADSRDRLVAHYTGGDRVTDPDEMFTIRWSRYLDVTRRDGDGTRTVDWELADLQTVNDAIVERMDAQS
ncbi:hypothetical protein KDN32_04670 [Nocardioides sp. J2M5]|uniref:hypothetical protein n=1 Tax=Nocardioides palaemonis TaxID=2829810 RepID=UPI001BADC4C5|nr:hypothetical protein [Nocardioides palaemonis]MBS2937035.1 hypothetical protein [Nocardioides palaemonis]